MKKPDFLSLIEMIKDIISKNRDLLSVDDITSLRRCVNELIVMDNTFHKQTTVENITSVVNIIVSIYKIFSDFLI